MGDPRTTKILKLPSMGKPTMNVLLPISIGVLVACAVAAPAGVAEVDEIVPEATAPRSLELVQGPASTWPTGHANYATTEFLETGKTKTGSTKVRKGHTGSPCTCMGSNGKTPAFMLESLRATVASGALLQTLQTSTAPKVGSLKYSGLKLAGSKCVMRHHHQKWCTVGSRCKKNAGTVSYVKAGGNCVPFCHPLGFKLSGNKACGPSNPKWVKAAKKAKETKSKAAEKSKKAKVAAAKAKERKKKAAAMAAKAAEKKKKAAAEKAKKAAAKAAEKKKKVAAAKKKAEKAKKAAAKAAEKKKKAVAEKKKKKAAEKKKHGRCGTALQQCEKHYNTKCTSALCGSCKNKGYTGINAQNCGQSVVFPNEQNKARGLGCGWPVQKVVAVWNKPKCSNAKCGRAACEAASGKGCTNALCGSCKGMGWFVQGTINCCQSRVWPAVGNELDKLGCGWPTAMMARKCETVIKSGKHACERATGKTCVNSLCGSCKGKGWVAQGTNNCGQSNVWPASGNTKAKLGCGWPQGKVKQCKH